MKCKNCGKEIKKAGNNGYYHKEAYAFYDCKKAELKKEVGK